MSTVFFFIIVFQSGCSEVCVRCFKQSPGAFSGTHGNVHWKRNQLIFNQTQSHPSSGSTICTSHHHQSCVHVRSRLSLEKGVT